MERVPEPELMDEAEQARAYAQADFEEPNAAFVAHLHGRLGDAPATARVLDLGCGPADIVVRLARRHPGWRFQAVDGAAAMLAHARRAVRDAALADRVQLVHARIQELRVEAGGYDIVLSNSLLHHLASPDPLWRVVREAAAPGATVLVMDLCRPDDEATVGRLVDVYAADAPAVLRRDFRNSLHAAFRPEEIREQLRAAGLASLDVERVSDRHLLVSGRPR